MPNKIRLLPFLVTLGLLLAMLVPLTASATVATGDWPQYMGGPQHLGVATGESLLSPSNVSTLTQTWSSRRGAWSSASPVVSGNLVYLVSAGRLTIYGRYKFLFALDLSSGSVVWRSRVGGAQAEAGDGTPAIMDGVIYVPTTEPKPYTSVYRGRITAFDAATGARLWSKPLPGGLQSSSLVAADGTLAIGSEDGYLYALDPATGARQWRQLIGSPTGCEVSPGVQGPCIVNSSPAIANGLIYVDSPQGVLQARHATDGSLVWQTSIGGADAGTATVRNGRVYLAEGGQENVFDAATGAPIWSAAVPGTLSHPAQSVTRRAIYLGTGGLPGDHGALISLSSTDGSVRWTTELGRLVWSAPVVANGVVFVMSDSAVYGLSAATGAVLWTAALSNNNTISPAVASGHVVAETVNSTTPLHVFALP